MAKKRAGSRPKAATKKKHPAKSKAATKKKRPAKPKAATKTKRPAKPKAATKKKRPAKPKAATKTKRPAKPKTKRRKPRGISKGARGELVDRVIILLTGGANIETARVFCRRAGPSEGDIEAVVQEARRRLTAAVEVHRDEEFSLAVRQLKHLYVAALGKDLTAAIQARKELNRLLWLYVPSSEPPADDSAQGLTAEELDLALGHLRPLGLADDATSLVELCRLAASKITEVLAESSRK